MASTLNSRSNDQSSIKFEQLWQECSVIARNRFNQWELYAGIQMARFDSYFICTSPRSGSTLLCDLLSTTGIAGNPDSYFHKPKIEKWLAFFELSPDESASELAVLRLIFDAAKSHGSLGTGIFGLRLQRPSFNFFIKQLAQLQVEAGTDQQRIESIFGRVCFIHLTRLDKVEQAISLLKAEQTGLWHVAPYGSELERLSEPKSPSYDAEAIRKRVAEVTSYDQCWDGWFSREKIKPLRISYEALSFDPRGTLFRILDHLGIDHRSVTEVEPGVAKMADRTSREWVERFRAEH